MTSRTWCYDRVLWLKQYFNISDEQVLFAHNKSIVAGDLFIDDRIEHVTTWSSANKLKPAILWKQPYNKNENHDLIINDWNFVVNKIERMRDITLI